MSARDPFDDEGNGENPKERAGRSKAPLRLVPAILVVETAPAMAQGAAKYGPYNWRDTKVTLTTYIEAIERHLLALKDGQDVDPDSGLTHVAHIAANCAIIMDATPLGQMVDDRPRFPGATFESLARQVQAEVKAPR